MQGTFQGATKFNSNVSNWNTSSVLTMQEMFYLANSFNQPIGDWDTSKVTSFAHMFNGASAFNQDIGNWNTSKVEIMTYMFRMASVFNKSIGNWDTSNVKNMQGVFANAHVFDRPIGNWNTSSVTNMRELFFTARNFNQDIGNWDVSKVTNMNNIFSVAEKFNKPIGSWNVGNVTTLFAAFNGAKAFNQDIGNWDTSKVTTMQSVFNGALVFNKPIGSWNVGNVTTLNGAFTGAKAFNQDIGNWDVGKVTDMYAMFAGATSFNQDIGNWNTSSLTRTWQMFYGATAFNQDIGDWDTSKLSDARWMFYGAKAFNQPITNWNTGNLNLATRMFYGASSFNQDISHFNISSLTDAYEMLKDSNMSSLNYDKLLISWSSQPKINPSVAFGAAGIYYCMAGGARTVLTSPPNNWSIVDAGLGSDELCDFCTPMLANTTPTEWIDESCSLDQMNQSRNWTEYDTLDCGEIDNKTYFEYQLVGPTFHNTTWNDWTNYTECLPDDNQTQIRNLTQYDSYGCAINQTFYEYQNVTCDYCTPSMKNTTESEWVNIGSCLITDQQNQSRFWTEYDENDCGEEENVTYIEYRLVPCDYCSYSLKNTTPTGWANFACSLDQMNQSQNWTEYDENYNSCYAVTGLDGDLWNNGENKTYYNYKLVGPTFQNTTWNDWINLSCLPDDKMNQSRNLTQFDIYGCAINTTFFEYKATEFCDFCIPNLVNTSWGAWTNYSECLKGDIQQQVRNLTQYDSNDCNETANQTFYEYQNATCEYVPPIYCGDGVCNGEETCHTCSVDCGYCRWGGSRIIPERIESFESLHFIKGIDNFILVEFFNKDETNPIREIEFSVEGDISKYFRISSEKLNNLSSNSSVNVTLEILSSDFFETGIHEMNVTLTGKKKNILYIENRVLTLKVLDLPTEEVREVSRTHSKEIILVFFGILFFVFILYKIISYVAIDLESKPLRKK